MKPAHAWAVAFGVASVLVFTMPAHAACAWVLWGQEHGGPWEVVEAFEKKAACDAGLSKSEERFSRMKKAKPVYFQCIPDTIDPRGPKGSR